MANKNNSRSPKGRFLTLRLRLIVNLTILETKKLLLRMWTTEAQINLCWSEPLLSTYAIRDLGSPIMLSDILKLYNIKMNKEASGQIARMRNLIKASVHIHIKHVDHLLRIDLNFPT